jgi:sensor c-di-GMP phosphodiesterase-like protein
MSQQLRRAIRRDKLRMVYQPIVALGSGRIVEAEALARWTDEDGFAVSPEIFVAIAEEHGFVGELTEMVVRHVLRDFAGVLRSRPEFVLNINVAAADLADPKFLPMLERYLVEAGVSAQSLAIEVTETSTANKQPARDTIHELRRLGHSVQIDDFGTGCSSLAYLKDLAIDTIKIDKAFTLAIGTEAVTVAILPSILAMADSLNLTVIAEGIETVEQACYFAAAKSAVLGQGWFFGHPVAAADFCRILAENQELEDNLADADFNETRTRPLSHLFSNILEKS